MGIISILIFALTIIVGIILIFASVNLIKAIQINKDKTVESISDKLNKNLIAVAVLTIAEAILGAINIFIK